jgi:hypothetical protein
MALLALSARGQRLAADEIRRRAAARDAVVAQ